MTIYSYKTKGITCHILTGSLRYMLILEVYSFLTKLCTLLLWGGADFLVLN